MLHHIQQFTRLSTTSKVFQNIIRANSICFQTQNQNQSINIIQKQHTQNFKQFSTSTSTEQTYVTDKSQRVKGRTPKKIASKLLSELNQEEYEIAKKRNAVKPIANFRAGDAIEVKVKGSMTADRVYSQRGVVLGISRRGQDTSFKLATVIQEYPILHHHMLYSPHIQEIKILQRAFIHKGKKRVRRAKLYYLWDKRDPREFDVGLLKSVNIAKEDEQ